MAKADRDHITARVEPGNYVNKTMTAEPSAAARFRGLTHHLGGGFAAEVIRLHQVKTIDAIPVATLEKMVLRAFATDPDMLALMPHDPFYWSAEWRAFRKAIFAQRGTCEVAGCAKPAKHLGHKISRRRGGASFDPANVTCMCHSHHSPVLDLAA